MVCPNELSNKVQVNLLRHKNLSIVNRYSISFKPVALGV